MGYLEIGFNVSRVLWVIGTIIFFIKPVFGWVLNKIGLQFEDYYDTDTMYQELCYAVFYDDDTSPAAKAGGWLLLFIFTQLVLMIGGLVLTLVWPIGVIFLIVWFVFSKKSKNKED